MRYVLPPLCVIVVVFCLLEALHLFQIDKDKNTGKYSVIAFGCGYLYGIQYASKQAGIRINYSIPKFCADQLAIARKNGW